MKLGAVILAAGAGTRLGGVAKALLTSDGNTFLRRIVDAGRSIGLDEAIVVVGPPFGEQVAAAAQKLGARVAWNAQPERGMASSIEIGFGELGEVEAAWLWPVDHPHVSSQTLRTLLEALGDHACARPVYAGRRGHPPLVARALWPQLCEGVPARDVIARADTIDVPVPDRGCVRDIDTPEDLA